MDAFLNNPHFIEVVIALVVAITALVKAQTAKVHSDTATKDVNRANAKVDYVTSKVQQHDVAIAQQGNVIEEVKKGGNHHV